MDYLRDRRSRERAPWRPSVQGLREGAGYGIAVGAGACSSLATLYAVSLLGAWADHVLTPGQVAATLHASVGSYAAGFLGVRAVFFRLHLLERRLPVDALRVVRASAALLVMSSATVLAVSLTLGPGEAAVNGSVRGSLDWFALAQVILMVGGWDTPPSKQHAASPRSWTTAFFWVLAPGLAIDVVFRFPRVRCTLTRDASQVQSRNP